MSNFIRRCANFYLPSQFCLSKVFIRFGVVQFNYNIHNAYNKKTSSHSYCITSTHSTLLSLFAEIDKNLKNLDEPAKSEQKAAIPLPEKYIGFLNLIVNQIQDNVFSIKSNNTFLKLLKHIHQNLFLFTPDEVAIVLNALVQLQHCHGKLFEDILYSVEGSVDFNWFNKLSVARQCQIILMLSTSPIESTAFKAMCEKHFLVVLEKLRIESPPQILTEYIGCIRCLNCLLLSLSNALLRNMEFIHMLLNETISILEFLQIQEIEPFNKSVLGSHLASMFLSSATLGVKNPNFYRKLLQFMLTTLSIMPMHHICNVALAMATLARDPDFPISLTFLSELQNEVLNRFQCLNGEDAITTCWSFCCLKLHASNENLIMKLLEHADNHFRMGTNYIEDSPNICTQLWQIHFIVFESILEASRKNFQNIRHLQIWKSIYEKPKKFSENVERDDLDIPEFAINIEDELECIFQNEDHFKILLVETLGFSHVKPTDVRIARHFQVFDMYQSSIAIYPHSEYDKFCKIWIDVDWMTYADFIFPLDPYLELRQQNLATMGWKVVRVRAHEYLKLGDNFLQKLDYLKNLLKHS